MNPGNQNAKIGFRLFSNRPPQKISIFVYRQLLRCCKSIDKDIPLSSIFPPITVSAPDQIDSVRMELLAQEDVQVVRDPVVERARKLLPKNTEYKKTHMLVPIRSADDITQFVREIFRLNSREPPEPEYQKVRLSMALQLLKSMKNEFQVQLLGLKADRKKHMDRRNVKFKIGQVVQHQHERWRGVIAAWYHPTERSATGTSLTSKDYTNKKQHIQYSIILDEENPVNQGSHSASRGVAVQADLSILTDPHLSRIRGAEVSEYFVGYDPNTCSFIPNALSAYCYPLDIPESQHTVSPEESKIYEDIISGVKEFATRLQQCVLDESHCPEEQGFNVLANILRRLENIQRGDALGIKIRLYPEEALPSTIAAEYLYAIYSFHFELLQAIFRREIAIEHKHRIKFRLGDIVKHKVFGFRGVIISWDPKPRRVVTASDGGQDSSNSTDQPFYEILCDENDHISAVYGESHLLYVREDHIEECDIEERNINLVTEIDWERDAEDGRFIPPDYVRYEFGDDVGNDEVLDRCLHRIINECNMLYLKAKEPDPSDNLSRKLSMKNLMFLLKRARSEREAAFVRSIILEMRNAHPNVSFRRQLHLAHNEWISGNAEKSADIYRDIADEDPSFVEAQHLVSTCDGEQLDGRTDDPIKLVTRVLESDPENFRATARLGFLNLNKQDYEKAATYFRKTVELDPWSAVAANLFEIHDKMIMQDMRRSNRG